MGGKSRYRSEREKANDAPDLRPGVRHVMVAYTVTRPDDTPWPGVIVDWRRIDGAWRAQVAYVSRDGHVTVGWLPPEQIRPVGD